jgi:hypothetical protein
MRGGADMADTEDTAAMVMSTVMNMALMKDITEASMEIGIMNSTMRSITRVITKAMKVMAADTIDNEIMIIGCL